MNAFSRLPGLHRLPDDLVEQELARIEASEGFRHSPQLRRLLRHLVESVQAGRAEQLREFALGVVVFRRNAATYDPKRDPIVRVESRRLRARLAEFYDAQPSPPRLRIELAKGGYVPVLQRTPEPSAHAQPTIAVLPFVNLGRDAELEPFCDGLTDELIDALVHLREAKVVARTSAFHFKTRSEDVRGIGRRLGAEMVLDGSVQVQQSHYRVIAQLIDARDGCYLWSQMFEAERSEVTSVQNAIASGIARSLHLAGTLRDTSPILEPAEAMIVRGTRDDEARELFDRARFIVRRLDLDRYEHARALLERALERDPDFARAHLMLGIIEINLVAHAATRSTGLRAAIQHVERALSLDAQLGSAHAMRGWLAMNHELDWTNAEAHYRRALAASPGDVTVRNGWGNFLTYTGRFADADAEYAMARSLDPLHVVPRINRALMLFYARAYEAALQEYRLVDEMDPHQVGTNVVASIHLMRRDAPSALAAANAIVERFPASVIGQCRKGEALAFAGKSKESRGVFEAAVPMLRAANVEHWARAHLLAAAGRFDAVLAELHEAAIREEANFCTAAVTPYFAPLHADSRWRAFVAQHRLPEVSKGAWSAFAEQ